MALGTSLVTRIAGDRAGAAAVEFALIMPLFATLFFGTFEVANLVLADMKLCATAQTAADLLVGRASSAGYPSNSDVSDASNAAARVMTPLPTGSQLKIAYASVTYGTGAPVINWHDETNGAGAITMATIPNGVDLTTLGGSAAGSSDSLIIVRVDYAYTSPVSYVLARTWSLSEAAFERQN
jgi:Flp pilus assembly protein TadG